jgi:hypothetical protein
MDRLKGNEITRDMIDLWISAEIPDPNEDPLGYVLVADHMMHGPCREKKPKLPMHEKR